MESFDIKGLTISLSDTNCHEQYVELKDTFEKAVINLQNGIRQHHFYRHNPISHGIKLKNYIVTFCVDGSDVEMGLYDIKTGEIKRNCDFSEIKDFRQAQQEAFLDRSELFIEACQNNLINNYEINHAWEEKLEEERNFEGDGPELSIEMDFD